MNKKIILLLLLIVIVGIVLYLALRPETKDIDIRVTALRQGKMKLAGVSVVLNGTGAPQMTGEDGRVKLPAHITVGDKMTIRASWNGMVRETTFTTIKRTDVYSYTFTFIPPAPPPGEIAVQTFREGKPFPGLSVSLSGQSIAQGDSLVGETPLEFRFPQGHLKIAVKEKSPGNFIWDTVIVVSAERSLVNVTVPPPPKPKQGITKLTVPVSPPPPKNGTVSITSVPPGAEILIDNAKQPKRTPMSITHRIGSSIIISAVLNDVRKDTSMRISRPSEKLSFVFPKNDSAIVKVTSTPDGASVSINNGEITDVAPFEVKLRFGKYTIAAEYQGKTQTRTLDVGKGENSVAFGFTTGNDLAFFLAGEKLFQSNKYFSADSVLMLANADRLVDIDQKTKFHYYRGFSLFKLQKYPDALSSVQKLLALHNSDPYGYYTRGLIHYEMNKYEDAIQDFQNVLANKLGLPQATRNDILRSSAFQTIKSYQMLSGKTEGERKKNYTTKALNECQDFNDQYCSSRKDSLCDRVKEIIKDLTEE